LDIFIPRREKTTHTKTSAAAGRGRTSSALYILPVRGSNRAAACAPAAQTALTPVAASSNPTISDIEDALDLG